MWEQWNAGPIQVRIRTRCAWPRQYAIHIPLDQALWLLIDSQVQPDRMVPRSQRVVEWSYKCTIASYCWRRTYGIIYYFRKRRHVKPKVGEIFKSILLNIETLLNYSPSEHVTNLSSPPFTWIPFHQVLQCFGDESAESAEERIKLQNSTLLTVGSQGFISLSLCLRPWANNNIRDNKL